MRERAKPEDQIRQLEVKHFTLEQELRVLSRRAYLTPHEQRLERELKKQKLSAKDQLYRLRTVAPR